ncbi:uncharacterized protein LOC115671782 [Syzygium oleosum]|uniref:uncharacterized protein LOC115671782 n=1 Tax=Syzygium oleosum TaxID=219896 RepID=UPI0011D20D12|nr:uncharacterized protein LOC115671782 [Syzygium oleosum]
MGRNSEESVVLNGDLKVIVDGDGELEASPTRPSSQSSSSRPTSMVIKKVNSVIPAHLVAEAISTLRGLDLRWSGPITPSEMQYVEQYILTKYPQYSNGLVEPHALDVDSLSAADDPDAVAASDDKRKSPRRDSSSASPSFSRSFSDLDRTQLEPSRLLDILTKKSSPQANFISIPEIQARNRALRHCGLTEEDYLVLFAPSYRDAMVMIGESYPFARGSYYLTIVGEEDDPIRDFAAAKEAKAVPAPATWLDLRIRGSQLSQYFRKKCKHVPKGLFAYPAAVDGTRYSMHWISEAHRNSWHVLLDAAAMVFADDHHLALALHRPDFVVCTLESVHVQPSRITCLLVRKRSFETSL